MDTEDTNKTIDTKNIMNTVNSKLSKDNQIVIGVLIVGIIGFLLLKK